MTRSRSTATKGSTQSYVVRTDELAKLIADLGSQDGQVRHKARLALVQIGDPAAKLLIGELGNPDDVVRWEAAKALNDIVDPRAAPALVDALEDRSFGVRWLAADALVHLGRTALPPLLRALTKRSSSVWLRRGAHHVLHDLALQGLHDQVAPVLKALEDVEPAIGGLPQPGRPWSEWKGDAAAELDDACGHIGSSRNAIHLATGWAQPGRDHA